MESGVRREVPVEVSALQLVGIAQGSGLQIHDWGDPQHWVKHHFELPIELELAKAVKRLLLPGSKNGNFMLPDWNWLSYHFDLKVTSHGSGTT